MLFCLCVEGAWLSEVVDEAREEERESGLEAVCRLIVSNLLVF